MIAPQTPRQQLQALLEDSLYHHTVVCKSCNFPLAPHQMDRGLCQTCAGTLSRLDSTDFEERCEPMGYRG